MAKKINSSDVVLELTNDSLKSLINKLDDLTDINEKLVFKFDKTNLLIYSFVEKGKDIHTFKSYILNMEDVFTKVGEISNTLKFISQDSKKLMKSLEIFLSFDEKVLIKLSYNEDNFVEKMAIKNSKMKLDFIGGLPSTVKQDVNIEQIKTIMDTSKASFDVKLYETDFDKIKKMSSIEKDNEIYYLTVRDNKVYMGENKWNLNIGDVEYMNESISFPKKYFNTINFDDEYTTLYVFDRFVMTVGKESNIMISVEI
jgi:hypothetical protein